MDGFYSYSSFTTCFFFSFLIIVGKKLEMKHETIVKFKVASFT